MGYLIIRVRPKHDVDARPVLAIAARSALGESACVGPGWAHVSKLLARHGFEAVMEIARVDPRLYPLTCVVYTSKNREGRGRSGSSLYRFPCRQLEARRSAP